MGNRSLPGCILLVLAIAGACSENTGRSDSTSAATAPAGRPELCVSADEKQIVLPAASADEVTEETLSVRGVARISIATEGDYTIRSAVSSIPQVVEILSNDGPAVVVCAVSPGSAGVVLKVLRGRLTFLQEFKIDFTVRE